MAIPDPNTCLMNAAAQLRLASDVPAGGNPEWVAARASLAREWRELAAAQEHRLNPEDAATWAPTDTGRLVAHIAEMRARHEIPVEARPAHVVAAVQPWG